MLATEDVHSDMTHINFILTIYCLLTAIFICQNKDRMQQGKFLSCNHILKSPYFPHHVQKKKLTVDVEAEDIFHEDAFIVDNHDEANEVCIWSCQ